MEEGDGPLIEELAEDEVQQWWPGTTKKAPPATDTQPRAHDPPLNT